MGDPDTLRAALAERDRAMVAGDLSWAARQLPPGTAPQVVEMAFHKARCEIVSIPAKYRAESRAWLAARGLRLMSGKKA